MADIKLWSPISARGHTTLKMITERELGNEQTSDVMLKKYYFEHKFQTEIKNREEWITDEIEFGENAAV